MPARVTYQLKIGLRGTRPPIWRRVLVSPSMTMNGLHEVIQGVMGWDDSHLHMFVKDRTIYSVPSPSGDGFALPGGPRELDERKHRIGQVLRHEKDHVAYEYDFGDSWGHRVTLQKILPYDPAVKLPVCIGGKRRCPPEDSGGVWGYYDKLEILKDKDHSAHEEIVDWMGDSFDPEEFSVEEADLAVKWLRE